MRPDAINVAKRCEPSGLIPFLNLDKELVKNDGKPDKPSLQHIQVEPPVPVFNLVVFVCRSGDRHSARIANLEIEPVDAATPRDAISKICIAAKTMLREMTSSKQPIPWCTPPAEKKPDENQFMVPVHL